MKRTLFCALMLIAAACSKKDDDGSAKKKGSGTMAGSGSSMAGSGSSMAGSGSSMAGSGSSMSLAGPGPGSGSAMAGSGSDAGSGSAVAAGSGAGSGSGSAAPVTGMDRFDKLSKDDKIAFMKAKVMPPMKTAFQTFDKEKFAKFNCKTCHGKSADKGGDFKMPNPDIEPLDFAALKAGKQKPKFAEFMAKIVTPQMAAIFEMPMHSEKAPNGFGCLECHTQKK